MANKKIYKQSKNQQKKALAKQLQNKAKIERQLVKKIENTPKKTVGKHKEWSPNVKLTTKTGKIYKKYENEVAEFRKAAYKKFGEVASNELELQEMKEAFENKLYVPGVTYAQLMAIGSDKISRFFTNMGLTVGEVVDLIKAQFNIDVTEDELLNSNNWKTADSIIVKGHAIRFYFSYNYGAMMELIG